jgi:hypothetical protein
MVWFKKICNCKSVSIRFRIWIWIGKFDRLWAYFVRCIAVRLQRNDLFVVFKSEGIFVSVYILRFLRRHFYFDCSGERLCSVPVRARHPGGQEDYKPGLSVVTRIIGWLPKNKRLYLENTAKNMINWQEMLTRYLLWGPRTLKGNVTRWIWLLMTWSVQGLNGGRGQFFNFFVLQWFYYVKVYFSRLMRAGPA